MRVHRTMCVVQNGMKYRFWLTAKHWIQHNSSRALILCLCRTEDGKGDTHIHIQHTLDNIREFGRISWWQTTELTHAYLQSELSLITGQEWRSICTHFIQHAAQRPNVRLLIVREFIHLLLKSSQIIRYSPIFKTERKQCLVCSHWLRMHQPNGAIRERVSYSLFSIQGFYTWFIYYYPGGESRRRLRLVTGMNKVFSAGQRSSLDQLAGTHCLSFTISYLFNIFG